MSRLLKCQASTGKRVILELEDLTFGLQSPCVMDVKMGLRTFSEGEVRVLMDSLLHGTPRKPGTLVHYAEALERLAEERAKRERAGERAQRAQLRRRRLPRARELGARRATARRAARPCSRASCSMATASASAASAAPSRSAASPCAPRSACCPTAVARRSRSSSTADVAVHGGLKAVD